MTFYNVLLRRVLSEMSFYVAFMAFVDFVTWRSLFFQHFQILWCHFIPALNVLELYAKGIFKKELCIFKGWCHQTV